MKKLLLTLTKDASEDLEPYCVTTKPHRLLCTSAEMTEMGLLRLALEAKSQPPAPVGSKRAEVNLLVPLHWIAWGAELPDTPAAIGFHPA